MGREDLRRFLVEVALDDRLRTTALADPDAAFAGFDLDEADKAVLRRRDAEVLRLIGEAIGGDPSRDPSSGDPSAGLVGGDSSGGATPVSGPEGVATGASRPGGPLVVPEVVFAVRLRPRVVPGGDGTWRVAYAASLEPLPAGAPADPGQPPAGAPADPGQPPVTLAADPWGHRVGSPEARAMADAVLASPPAERRARLHDLARALRGDEP